MNHSLFLGQIMHVQGGNHGHEHQKGAADLVLIHEVVHEGVDDIREQTKGAREIQQAGISFGGEVIASHSPEKRYCKEEDEYNGTRPPIFGEGEQKFVVGSAVVATVGAHHCPRTGFLKVAVLEGVGPWTKAKIWAFQEHLPSTVPSIDPLTVAVVGAEIGDRGNVFGQIFT